MSKLFVLVVLLSVFQVRSQETGYYGKKLFLDVVGNAALPVFPNISRDRVVNTSGAKSYLWKDFGGRISLGVITGQNTAIAFEYAYRQYDFNPVHLGELNRHYTDASGYHEQYIAVSSSPVGLSEQNYVVKSVFAIEDGRVPTGLSFEVGGGYSEVLLHNQSVQFAGSDSLSQSISAYLLDPRVKVLKGMTLFYGTRLSYPVTRFLLFNFGFRYAYNPLFGKKKFRNMGEDTEYWMSPREIWSRVNHRRTLGIVSFSFGLTFCF